MGFRLLDALLIGPKPLMETRSRLACILVQVAGTYAWEIRNPAAQFPAATASRD
jgi:hypothetical protein